MKNNFLKQTENSYSPLFFTVEFVYHAYAFKGAPHETA